MRSDSSLLEHLPVQSMIEEVGLTSDSPGWLTAILRARKREDFGGDDLVSADELSELDIAGLHIGGWDDAMIRETLRHFTSVGRGAAEFDRGPLGARPPPWKGRRDKFRPPSGRVDGIGIRCAAP